MILEALLASPWLKWIVINQIISLLLLEWALYQYEPLRIKTKRDQEEAEKYPEFRRLDQHKLSRTVLYIFSPFIMFRFFIGWGSTSIMFTWTKLWMIGCDRSKPIP
jgi:hypothetical protein